MFCDYVTSRSYLFPYLSECPETWQAHALVRNHDDLIICFVFIFSHVSFFSVVDWTVLKSLWSKFCPILVTGFIMILFHIFSFFLVCLLVSFVRSFYITVLTIWLDWQWFQSLVCHSCLKTKNRFEAGRQHFIFSRVVGLSGPMAYRHTVGHIAPVRFENVNYTRKNKSCMNVGMDTMNTDCWSILVPVHAWGARVALLCPLLSLQERQSGTDLDHACNWKKKCT